MKKQSPIEQFVKIIGEENFHIFHAEYLDFNREDSIEDYIKRKRREAILGAFFWDRSLMGIHFYSKLDAKLQKKWRG